jgi:hypothetical protein
VGDRREHVFVLPNNAVNQVVNVRIVVPTLSKQMIVIQCRRINDSVIISYMHIVDFGLVAGLVIF